MIIIKEKISVLLIAFILIIPVFLSACAKNSSNVPPNEKIELSDKNGMKFYIQVTPCADNKSNGKITLDTDEKKLYLYSSDCGRTFEKIRDSKAVLNRLSEGSYSFCFMEKDFPETITDIYTVYAGDISNSCSISAIAVSSAEKISNDGTITICVKDQSGSEDYEATIDGWKTCISFSGKTVGFESLGQGVYSVSVRDKKNPVNVSHIMSVPVVHSEIGTSAYINVEPILQNPELPTGCEVTSLTMLLNHIGFDVDKLTLSDGYLPKGEYRKSDFNKVFVGNPRSRQAYGCTAGVIAETAEKFLEEYDKDNKWQVKNITGCPAKIVYSAIKYGNPVIVWSSIDMEEIIENHVSWVDESTGNTVSWFGNEHCLLLTGYNTEENLVYVNDPLRGQISYDMKIFEKRFNELDRNAVIIINK